MSNLVDHQYSQELTQNEVAKRRLENVKALEEKQKQLELESFRRSEAIEATRREQLRKQRHNEKLLQDAAEAADREEQERIRAEKVEREQKRLRELEEQKKRIEQAKADEKARQLAREKQLKEQREAAAAAKAEEERRRQQLLEETAGERMKKSFDRLLDKLGTTISADKSMMEEDTAKRRRERQLASDAATALSRVKAIEHTLQKHREHGREVTHQKIEKEEHEDLDERFHVAASNQDPSHSYLSPLRKENGGENPNNINNNKNNLSVLAIEQQQQQHNTKNSNTTSFLYHNPDENMSPEKLCSILLAKKRVGSNLSMNNNNGQRAADDEENENNNNDNGNNNNGNNNSDEDDNEDEEVEYEIETDENGNTVRKMQQKPSSKKNKKGGTNANVDENGRNTTSYFGRSVTASTTGKKRELKPLDYETWKKQREAEAELVSLSLEYQMRTA